VAVPKLHAAVVWFQERATLLDGNRKEIEGLLEKRSKMENDFLERYLNQVG
jgi:hypothetical protein